jgi:TPR repeat protein
MKAAALYKLAADVGFTHAQAALGDMYLRGEGGLPKNTWEALRLLTLAATQGDAGGHLSLAICTKSAREICQSIRMRQRVGIGRPQHRGSRLPPRG